MKFYTYEMEKYQGILVYEWLLECAKKQGIQGGSVWRSIAGYGRFGVIHEEHFFELASNVPVEIQFVVKKEEAESLICVLKEKNFSLFYTLTDVEFGHL